MEFLSANSIVISLGGGGVGSRPGAWFGQRREALGSPGLYLLALSGMRLTLIYNKVTFCYGRRQPLAQKVKAVKATQNLVYGFIKCSKTNLTQGREWK